MRLVGLSTDRDLIDMLSVDIQLTFHKPFALDLKSCATDGINRYACTAYEHHPRPPQISFRTVIGLRVFVVRLFDFLFAPRNTHTHTHEIQSISGSRCSRVLFTLSPITVMCTVSTGAIRFVTTAQTTTEQTFLAMIGANYTTSSHTHKHGRINIEQQKPLFSLLHI